MIKRKPSEARSLPNVSAFGRADVVYFAASFVFIYTQLFQLPFTPIYFEGDSLVSISNAMRMVGSEVMYRDFFHMTPPGAEVVYAVLFSIFGVKVWVLNLVILLLGLAQVWLTWFLSRKFLRGVFVYLPGAILLVVGYRFFGIDGSYRLFSVVAVLAAVAVLVTKLTPRNLVFAGCLCGLASFFVQPRGLAGLAGIGLFLTWKNYRQGFDLKGLVKSGFLIALPFLVVVILTQFYFAWQGGLGNYYFDLVTFLRSHYPNDPLQKRSAYLTLDLPDLQSVFGGPDSTAGAVSRYVRMVFPVAFFYLLVPFVYFMFLIYRWLRKTPASEQGTEAGLMLLCLVGLTLAAAVSAPTAGRLNHVSIPALVILVWLIKQIPYSSRIASAVLVFLGLLGISYVVQRQFVEKNYLDMPAGRAAFLSPPVYAQYKWIKENTSEGDVFYEAQHPSFYFPFHLKNPTPMYLVRDSDYTPRFQVDSVVSALERQPPKLVVWDGNWSKTAETRPAGDNLDPLWQFIATKYDLAVEFAVSGEYNPSGERRVQIWRLKGQDEGPTTP